MTTTVQLIHSKTTKGTYVFTAAEDDKDPPIPTLYIKKEVFGSVPPVAIKVTITPEVK